MKNVMSNKKLNNYCDNPNIPKRPMPKISPLNRVPSGIGGYQKISKKMIKKDLDRSLSVT